MSSFERKIIQQIINKLGYQDDSNLIEKATELVRLLELKSSSSKYVSSVGSYGRMIICVDLAAEQLGIPMDMDNLLKISALKNSVYMNCKKTIEKLLNLSQSLNIKEICTQLNMNEIINKSQELYELFKYKNSNKNIDLTHIQYKIMAIYQASKLLKKKLNKTILKKYCNLKSIQWTQLEQQWDKMIINEETSLKIRSIDENHEKNKNHTENQEDHKNDEDSKRKIEETEEDYEIWKKRMIKLAKIQLDLPIDD